MKFKTIIIISMAMYMLIMGAFFTFLHSSPAPVTKAQAAKMEGFDFDKLITLVKDMHQYLNADTCGLAYGWNYDYHWEESTSFKDTYQRMIELFEPLIDDYNKRAINHPVLDTFFQEVQRGLQASLSEEFNDRVIAHRIFHDSDYHLIGDVLEGYEANRGKDYFRITGLKRGSVLEAIRQVQRELQ